MGHDVRLMPAQYVKPALVAPAMRMRQQTVQLRPRKPHLRPPLLKTKLLKGSSTKRLPRAASKSWRTKNSHAPKPSGRRSCVASALDARGWAFVPGGRLADWREACASFRMPAHPRRDCRLSFVMFGEGTHTITWKRTVCRRPPRSERCDAAVASSSHICILRPTSS